MTTTVAPDAAATVFDVGAGYLAPRALHVIVESGVADALGDGPATTATLAAAVDADPDALGRLLRLLADRGVFHRDEAGRWGHTPASRLLRADHPASLRSWVRMIGGPTVWNAFTALDRTLRTGRPGTVEAGGLWGALDARPEETAIFDEAMVGQSRGDVRAALAVYDFSRHRRIADIGGGRGHVLAAVLDAAPGTTGVLFDLPRVTERAVTVPRMEIESGDFFRDPLPACDAYLLKQVVHDWADPEATALLTAVARAGARQEATVLLLEWCLPDDGRPHPATSLDVMMLATTGGRERTAGEYGTLLDGAGIDLVAVHPTPGPLSIVEGRVRP